MEFDLEPRAAAVAGLARSDPHGPGLTRRRDGAFAVLRPGRRAGH